MAKRYHYICEPHLPVATKKRIQFKVGRIHFFDIQQQEFICASPAAIAMPFREFGSHIAVPLKAAKALVNHELHNVYALHTDRFDIEEDAFTESVLSYLSRVSSFDSLWYAPAGFLRGKS